MGVQTVLTYIGIVLYVLSRTLYLKIVYYVCPPLFRRYYESYMAGVDTVNPQWDMEECARTDCSFVRMVEPLVKTYQVMFHKRATEGDKAPNPTVLTRDGKTEVRLLDSARPGVPLVLNFGSCT